MVIFVTMFMVLLYDNNLVIVITVLLLAFVVLFYTLRTTIDAVGQSESDIRLKLFRNVHNEMLNRAVVQSIDGVLPSRNKYDMFVICCTEISIIWSIFAESSTSSKNTRPQYICNNRSSVSPNSCWTVHIVSLPHYINFV